jgi:hypothetical protein
MYTDPMRYFSSFKTQNRVAQHDCCAFMAAS